MSSGRGAHYPLLVVGGWVWEGDSEAGDRGLLIAKGLQKIRDKIFDIFFIEIGLAPRQVVRSTQTLWANGFEGYGLGQPQGGTHITPMLAATISRATSVMGMAVVWPGVMPLLLRQCR